MKPKHLHRILLLLTLSFLGASCKSSGSKTEATGNAEDYYFYSKYGKFTADEYTKWMTFPELQDFTDKFDYSANTIYLHEGRDYRGLSQFRYAFRKNDGGKIAYQIRGDRTSEEFKNLGITYIRDGYELISLQLFKDSSGVTRHQGIWFKYNTKK